MAGNKFVRKYGERGCWENRWREAAGRNRGGVGGGREKGPRIREETKSVGIPVARLRVPRMCVDLTWHMHNTRSVFPALSFRKSLNSSHRPCWKASSPIRQPLSPPAFASRRIHDFIFPSPPSSLSFSSPILPPLPPILPPASLKKIGENLKRLAPSIGPQGVEERERERQGWPLSECLSCVRGLRWIPLDDQHAHRCTHIEGHYTKYTLTQSPPTTTFLPPWYRLRYYPGAGVTTR